MFPLHISVEYVEILLVILILSVDICEDSCDGIEHESEDDCREKHDERGIGVLYVVRRFLGEIMHHNCEGPVDTLQIYCDPLRVVVVLRWHPRLLDVEDVDFKLSQKNARACYDMTEDEDLRAELEEEQKVVFV